MNIYIDGIPFPATQVIEAYHYGLEKLNTTGHVFISTRDLTMSSDIRVNGDPAYAESEYERGFRHAAMAISQRVA